MAKAERSGISVQQADVPLILAMIARGDRKHDIAAWFGLNQGRVADVEGGKHGMPPLANSRQLPPSGSPGPKARQLRDTVDEICELLRRGGDGNTETAVARLETAIVEFDQND